jgi:hypothetical protein
MTLLIHFCCRYDVLTQLTTRAPYASPVQLISDNYFNTLLLTTSEIPLHMKDGRIFHSRFTSITAGYHHHLLHLQLTLLSTPPVYLSLGSVSCQFNISFPSFLLSSCISFSRIFGSDSPCPARYFKRWPSPPLLAVTSQRRKSNEVVHPLPHG